MVRLRLRRRLRLRLRLITPASFKGFVALALPSDPPLPPQVLLYQLFKDFVVRKFALHLYSRHVALSVVDNLLLVHSLDSHVVLLCDV